MARRETPEEASRRHQRELMNRLNAQRDARLTTRQQNDMKTKGAPPAPPRAAAPAPTPQPRPNTARDRQIDRAVDRASRGKDPNSGGSRGRR